MEYIIVIRLFLNKFGEAFLDDARSCQMDVAIRHSFFSMICACKLHNFRNLPLLLVNHQRTF